MFELPNLQYSYDALEPVIDAKTMEIHHSKHHQGYVDKLNDALKNHNLDKKSVKELLKDLNDLPEEMRTAIKNNGGGHANHSLFWEIMIKGGTELKGGDLKTAINNKFVDLGNLKTELSELAKTQFGSGWAWLVVKPDKTLDIYSTPNQDSPYSQGDTPILGIDIWEHAYYLNYQNRRAEYIKNWWNVVSWEKVEYNYKKIMK